MSREEFVRVVTVDQPDSPAYFTYDAVLNSKERPTLEQALAEGHAPLSLDEVLAVSRARRPGPRCALEPRLRRRAPARRRQHRTRRQLRDLGGNAARPRAADRDRRRAGARAGGVGPARADRLRQRRGVPRRRHAGTRRPARARRAHRPDHRRRRSPSSSPGPTRRSSSTSAPRASATGSASPAASTSRSAACRRSSTSCRAPADRRPLLVGLPLLDRREHPAPKRVHRGLGPRRRAQRSASAISLSSVFQLRAVPATPRRRSK